MKWVVGFRVMGYGGGFAEIEDSGRSCPGIRYLTYDVSRRSGCRNGAIPEGLLMTG